MREGLLHRADPAEPGRPALVRSRRGVACTTTRLGALLLLSALALSARGLSAAEAPAPAPGAEGCAMCHLPGPAGRRVSGAPPAFAAAALQRSPPATLTCVSCHQDLDGKEFPHEAKLAQ